MFAPVRASSYVGGDGHDVSSGLDTAAPPFRMQTSYEGIVGEKPEYGKLFGFDHIHWW